jgi:hypothetical protein
MDHHRIDRGEASPLKNRTPVRVPDGTVPYDKHVRKFTERAKNMNVSFIRWYGGSYRRAVCG